MQRSLAINTLEARLVELELKEQALLSKYTEQSRLVRNVRDEIRRVRKKLTEQETKRYGKTRSGVNTTYQRLQENLLRNETELKAIRAKKETQSAHLAESQRRLEKVTKNIALLSWETGHHNWKFCVLPCIFPKLDVPFTQVPVLKLLNSEGIRSSSNEK